MKRAFVTGASGFIGRVLCDALAANGYLVRAALRVDGSAPASASEKAVVGDIAAEEVDWKRFLANVDVVFHLAAAAHGLRTAKISADHYLATNAEATKRLINCAATVGVSRFIYLSSVKVNGESTVGRPFTAFDVPAPKDAYARSKWSGEQYVWLAARNTGIDAVVVRSPLVYGARVRANFLRLIRWIERGWPLPLGAVDNLRSMISVWNLADALICTATHPAAVGHVWMVSDAHDLSTPQLMGLIAESMGRQVRLVSVPLGVLRLIGAVSGLNDELSRLCDSLVVDISAIRSQLVWTPPVSVAEGVTRTVRWYLSQGRAHAD